MQVASTDALFSAIDAGDLERVSAVLDHDPSLAAARDQQGVSAVLHALYHQQPRIAERLYRAARDLQFQTSGRPEDHTSRRLEDASSKTPDQQTSPGLDIFDVVGMGDADDLRRHLQARPELLNAYSVDGFTPLQLAAFFGRRAAVELLLERGADVSLVARHAFGITALHAALAGPDPDLARPLIEAGADVNARQQGGFTPLHTAAQNGSLDLARLLLKRGARADAAAEDGRTPREVARDEAMRELLGRA